MPRRSHFRDRPSWTVIASISLALLGAACAGQAGSTSSTSPSLPAVHVTIRDTGRHIAMHVGEHLILALGPVGPGGGSPGPATSLWSVTTTPSDVLRLVSDDAATGHFDFLAMTTGTGVLRVVGRLCGPPMAAQAGGPPCPVAGASSQDAPAAPMVPIRLFALTVTVD